MASTPVQLTLDRDEITLDDLTEAIAAFTGYLESLDVSQSPNGRRTHDFRLVSLSYDSPAHIVAVAEPRENYRDNGPALAAMAVRGPREIAGGTGRPEGFPDEALENLKRLARLGTNGRPGAVISAPTLHASAAVAPALAAQVDRVLSQGDSVGSIEGQLDTISVHGRPYFTLYDAVSGRGVRCYFSDEQRATVIPALGKKVLAHGRLRRDPAGVPRELRDLDELTILGRSPGSPDTLPGIFAGLDVREYLRDLRGEQ